MQTKLTSTVARFFMVGEAETLERMARTAKRVVMNFILIDILFLYRLMVEEERVGRWWMVCIYILWRGVGKIVSG